MSKEIKETKENKDMVYVKLPRVGVEQEDVFVSVNNRTYIVKRGEKVAVPKSVAEVLAHQEKMLETIMNFQKRNAKG